MSRKKEPVHETEKYTFPSRLRGLMESTGTRQWELAKVVGVRPQTISLYCQGQSFPDVNNLTKIARFFDVSADYLVGLSDNPSTKEDIQVVYKTTGLSKEAIDALKESNGWGLDVLNCFLENSDFYRLLLEVRRLATAKYRLKVAETHLTETGDGKKVKELTDKRIIQEYWTVEKFKELQNAVTEELVSRTDFQKMVDMADRAVKKEAGDYGKH